MIVEFTVGNFRSFREKVTLSMVAAAITAKYDEIDFNNVIPVDSKLRLLTSAAIYGANACGKSNFISAISFMKHLIMSSAKDTQLSEDIAVDRFQLCPVSETEPAYFELIFLIEGTRYRYGFEVDTEQVVSEWLYFVPKSREAKLFERHFADITLGANFKEGRKLPDRTRKNALFLSVAAQFNGAVSGKILEWFSGVKVNLGISHDMDQVQASFIYDLSKRKERILSFIRALDLNIEDVISERVPFQIPEDNNLPEDLLNVFKKFEGKEQVRIGTKHRKYDTEGNVMGFVDFDMVKNESHGTQRIFGLAPMLIAALERGKTVWMDELDVRLHPVLTRHIVDLFNNKKTNPHNAQLIFTTHDTNLLSNKIFRRDQIWFIEKDRKEISHLYSLAEFRIPKDSQSKIRNDAQFEKGYIKGRYGAVPFLGDMESVFSGV